MTNEEIFELYKLQSANVRQLSKVKKNLIKDINFYLRKSDHFQVELKTKLLALLYSAWSEAQFIQIVYTPSSFSLSEIRTIKLKKMSGIGDGWDEMVNIAIQKVDSSGMSSDLQEKKDKLIEIIEKYIGEPSQLRHKIAHGQWVHALNKKAEAIELDLTRRLQQLDYVEITKQFEVHKYLGLIIRDLVQSPNRGFDNNYLLNITKLENYLNKTTDWNMATKERLLKPIRDRAENP